MNPRSIDKQQAQELIKETFESSFDKSGFTNFIKNLLNRIDEDSFIYQGNYIPDAYKQYIKTLERIGKFSDGENRIDILVITLQKDTSLERARTMQRNFIAWYLNGSRGGKLKEAALAAFVSPGKEDWRFSLVKMDYKFEQTKSGSMKVKEEFTPARRWSFLVGANEKSHTAQSRLVDILKETDPKYKPTLAELEKAFDIESVTKEFFLKYRELFLHTKEELDRVVKKDPKIKADFEAKGVDTVNFAKKLLGQIIFLYFLQKKGWFGVGRDDDWDTGSKHFLRELFKKKHGDYNNFFNDILEPLFYDALRNDRSHDDGYYSRFNCKIPFLNGGLFDPIGNYDWVRTDILLPNKLFSNQTKTKEGDAGTGILDVFDRYNFTVKEDEPLEKEVAIDPELLGKSYEKFNAIRPDNYAEFKKALKSGKKGEENKFNKKFGVYYTPREIVHYMCQQSLINYLHTEVIASKAKQSLIPSKEDIEALIHTGEQVSENEAIFLKKEQKIKKGEQKTTSIKLKLSDNIRKNAKLIDDKLAEITVCDPAVGSGAFPVGMMSEIVKARNVLSVFLNDKNRKTYNFKRRCIEHSLYGVDIDSGAVEIAKLRLWLSLVVDEDDIKNIKPLPNLDYRIMQGNSLISEFMGINFDDDENKNLKKEIKKLNAEIKTLEKEKSDKDSKSARHYKKNRGIDQNLSNKINILNDKIKKIKNKHTLLNKKLNHQEESPEMINLISEFQKKKNTFLNESNVSRKTQLKNEVDVLLIKTFETKLKTQKADYFNRLKNIENKYSVVRNEKQRDELIKQDKEKFYKESGFDLESAEKQLKEFTSGRKIKPFFLWNLYFSEVFLSGVKSASGGHSKGGFDVVIANPPYVRQEAIRKQKSALKAEFGGFFTSTADLFTYFYRKAFAVLSDTGHLCFISPNKFFRAGYGKNLRYDLAKNKTIRILIDFGELPVFDAGTDPAIVLAGNHKTQKNSIIVAVIKEKEQIADVRATVKELGFSIDQSQLQIEGWTVEPRSTLQLLEKLKNTGMPLSRFVNGRFYRGVLTGFNDAFVIDEDTRNALIAENRNSAKVIQPWLRGKDIKRWYADWQHMYVINISCSANKTWPWSHFDPKDEGKAEKVFKREFPAISRRLSHWKRQLKKRDDQGRFYWELRSCVYTDEFALPKLVYNETSKEFHCLYDENALTINKTGFILLCDSPKYLLGVLNSRLLDYFYRHKFPAWGDPWVGGRIQFRGDRMGEVPIPEGNDSSRKAITRLVMKAITDKEADPAANVSEIEGEIDQLVYKLYDLTSEEIKIVEGKNKNAN